MRRTLLILVTIGGAAVAGRAAETSADFTPHLAWERYEVIPGRNIFLKSRPHTFTAAGSHTAPPPPPPPTNTTTVASHAAGSTGGVEVLRGLWMLGEEPTAFFENSATGAVTPVGAGAKFQGGTLDSVTLDAVEFKTASATRRITIGFTLDGTPAPAPIVPAAVTTPAAAPATGGTAAPAAVVTEPAPANAAEATLLQKMRERRLKEMGK